MAGNESLVDAFVEYTSGLPSPVLWRKWAAIGMMAGAIERKLWVYTYNRNLYPNQYIFLLGPPGVGKTVLTSVVQDLWGSIGDINVAPSALSSAAFLDALRESGEKTLVRPSENPPTVRYHTISGAINELGVFLAVYDNEFIPVLTDLYDCQRFAERKRTTKLSYTLEAPCVNLIGCGTPSFLGDLLPDGAWDQGFMSRVIMVYSGVMLRPPLFSTESENKVAYNKLKDKLKRISDLYGKAVFQKETVELVEKWNSSGGKPIPEHPKLINYNTRRTAKLLKLMVVAMADSGSKLVMTPEHFQTALGWLLEAEAAMPEVFKSMKSGGESKVIEDLWHTVYTYYVKHRRGMPEHLIYEFLQAKVASVTIKPLLEHVKNSRKLIQYLDENGKQVFKPGEQAE